MRLVVSDIHLRSPRDQNYAAFRCFLEKIRDQVSHLYILGDLFEFWFGHSRLIHENDLPILSTLLRYKEAGIPMTYVVGNHDYHPGPLFEDLLSARVVYDSIDETWEGTRVHMTHGDLANPKDYGYRFLRFVLRSRFGLFLPRLVPQAWLRRLAFAFSSSSKYVRDPADSLVQAQKEYARRKLEEGYALVIQGHSHHPFLERVALSGRTGLMANVGDGMSHYTCLAVRDGGVDLCRYKTCSLETLKTEPLA